MSNEGNAAHFAPTGILLDMDKGRDLFRTVHIPSEQAKTWDGAGASTNCTVYTQRHEVHCYAELKITGRGPRRHTGGIWGWAARVRFTSTDEDTTEWFSVVAVTDGRPW